VEFLLELGFYIWFRVEFSHTLSVKGYRQAKFAYGGQILSSSQYLPLTQCLIKTMLAIKVVNFD
jgi:hypothetical protein